MMVVTNLENEQFSEELGSVILNNREIQDRLLDHIIQTAKQLNFRDIHFDIEHLSPADREAYNAFLHRAVIRIHQEGFLMSTALAPKTSAVQTGEWYTAHAKAISPQAAIELARDRHVEILYDYSAQAPYYDYIDDSKKSHKVWFEDARSIQAKFNLVKELGIRGVSYWKLGLAFPQNWLLIEDNFRVVKR
jgi:spore germination protein YaaH